MFLDASAIVAILSGEAEQVDLAARIDAAKPPLYVSRLRPSKQYLASPPRWRAKPARPSTPRS